MIPTSINALAVRRSLNRDIPRWGAPELFGPDGWRFVHSSGRRSCIVTCAPDDDGTEWLHASITGDGAVPSYEDLKAVHRAVFGAGWSYQVFTPPADHVNIHPHALHLFGRLDGSPALPDFTRGSGSI